MKDLLTLINKTITVPEYTVKRFPSTSVPLEDPIMVKAAKKWGKK